VVMALGTHRPMTQAEFVRKLGKEVVERVQVENHDFKDAEKLVYLGTTPNGTPISVNRRVYEADWKIGVGNIVPHHISGWAGGAKIVQPGVCGEETTASTHLFSVRKRGSYLGAVENPVRQEMETIARRVRLNTVFNTVLNRRGRMIRAFYGDTAEAFRAGVKEAERVYCVKIPAKADIVLASSHPCDLDFWQAHKTLYSSNLAVKDGGTIIIVTPCPEGVSKMHPELLEIAHLTAERIEAKLKAGEIEDKLAAALAIAWSTVRRRANVLMVTEGIPAEQVQAIGFQHCETTQEALELAFKKQGEDAKVTVLEGAETLPTPPEADT
ncbi:MAG: nickel-dependent lactate racemase, partial [Candidatus Bathyarchaeia archaeon]